MTDPLSIGERWALALLFYVVASWFVMLGVGVVHAEILGAVVPCGIGPAFGLTALFNGAWLFLRASNQV